MANKGEEPYFIEKKEVEKVCLEGMAAGGRGEFGLQVVMSSRGLGLPLDRRAPLSSWNAGSSLPVGV